MSVINTNIKALVARDSMATNNRELSTAMERLSTGKRINSAADDAAGLSISSRMDSQVRGLQMAVKNANDAISVTQTAEGAMQEITDILQRMRELSVQSASDSNSDEDRAFLQSEVSQLSAEIDRIATTTQFNGINVLDGGFENKTFQIGANSGQTLGISIGDMKASALGVTTSAIASGAASAVSPPQTETVVVSATGSAATVTESRLTFAKTDNSLITFDLADASTGLSASVSATLDMTDAFSVIDFETEVNKQIAQAAANTNVTAASAVAAFDMDDVDNYSKLKFSIQLDGGTVENIDLRAALRDAGESGTITASAIASALTTELRDVFNDENLSLSATTAASNTLSITDLEGRSISITQGAGDGTLFGTDVANDGPLAAEGNTKMAVTAAWDGEALVLRNTSGDSLTVKGYSAATAVMTVDAVDGQNQVVLDPIVFSNAAFSNIDGDDAAKFIGVTEETSMSLSFSNRTEVVSRTAVAGTAGAAAAATAGAVYAFDITNGDGDTYMSIALNMSEDQTDAQVITAVKTALSAGIAANFGGDTSITMEEFDVNFDGATLQITNSGGRALKVENFESYAGTMTVTPLNELGAASTLASQKSLFSEMRIQMNPAIFGVDMQGQAASAGQFAFRIDGQSIGTGAAIQVPLDGTNNANLSSFAAALQVDLRALNANSAFIQANGTDTSAVIDMTDITVAIDKSTNELIIRQRTGHSMSFGLQAGNPLEQTGMLFTTDQVSAPANDSNVIKTAGVIVQGDVVDATKVKLSLNVDVATINFEVNGQALGATVYDATDPFAGSALETSLDAMMATLNGAHGSNVFEYAVSGRDITITQRDGGAVNISNFASTGATGDDLVKMTIAGLNTTSGTTVVASQVDAATGLSARAEGTQATRTEATLTLSGDDMFSLTVNNGIADYTLSNTVVDISDSTSTQAFANALTAALAGSGIGASMDTSGNVNLTRDDGGVIGLKSLTSAAGSTATWTPRDGQGTASSVAGNGSLTEMVASDDASPVAASGGSDVAVSEISIATQASAAAALDVLDSALGYVNAERSNLGAIENRLSHTIDNLSNVVTNTAAARSRILDTDYAVETSELARTQIIQQAATAMLAQANQSSQSVLSLLQ